MEQTPPEYVASRAVLIDALVALEPQNRSLVLVGAQAIYLHTGDVAGMGVATTTDSDLAVDTDLLSDDPDVASILEKAGFIYGEQPGFWLGAGGVRVDIMVVPHQSRVTKKTARAANLDPQDKRLARITPGLEATLVDHAPLPLAALDQADARSITVNVAGPAALLVAKAIKIAERDADVAAGKKNRLKSKDAVDCLRLLSEIEPEDMLAGFQRHASAGGAAAEVSRQALTYLDEQHRRGDACRVRQMIAGDIGAQAAARYVALVGDLLQDCVDASLLDVTGR